MANSVFLNNVPVNFTHAKVRKSDGGSFVNVTIPWSGSKNGFGNFAISCGQKLSAFGHKDNAESKLCNILLGAPDRIRNLSILTDSGFERIQVSNQQIADAYADWKADYSSKVAEATEEEIEVA